VARAATVLLDDRLLIEELLIGLQWGRRRPEVYTSTYWYYRACRAAVAGAGGHLAGPFEQLAVPEQERAILSLLELRDDVGLPDPRVTVPAMAELSRRHPRLNVLNVEAAASALVLGAEVWLSPAASAGVLPRVLESENVCWSTIETIGQS
jgi:hypothetical protein